MKAKAETMAALRARLAKQEAEHNEYARLATQIIRRSEGRVRGLEQLLAEQGLVVTVYGECGEEHDDGMLCVHPQVMQMSEVAKQ